MCLIILWWGILLDFHRAPSCPEIPEISQLSWNCPEISNCPEILLIWSECPDMDLSYAVAAVVATLFTSHDYAYVADVERQVMFSLVALPSVYWCCWLRLLTCKREGKPLQKTRLRYDLWCVRWDVKPCTTQPNSSGIVLFMCNIAFVTF